MATRRDFLISLAAVAGANAAWTAAGALGLTEGDLTWGGAPALPAGGGKGAKDRRNPAGYALLSDADGPFYFAREHLSHAGAGRQGAFMSSHRTVAMVDAAHRGGQTVTTARPFGHA